MGVNRNKRSAVLDLKQEAAREALWRLIDSADVFLHSIRPQKLARLGFDHESVCDRNPRIVYAGLHGYRTDGPLWRPGPPMTTSSRGAAAAPT